MPLNGVVVFCRFLDEFQKANPIEEKAYIGNENSE